MRCGGGGGGGVAAPLGSRAEAAAAVVRAVAGFAAATLEPAIMQRHIPKYTSSITGAKLPANNLRRVQTGLFEYP